MRNLKAKVSDPNKFISSSGSDVHVIYEGKLLPTGEIRLVPVGKESVSEKINSYAKFTDISYIMSRLNAGDTSVLRDGAMYGDFTKTPKSLADALQIMINGEKKFNELPLEVRNKFNNSYLAWMQSAGSDIWFDNMGIVRDEKVIEPIVKESEEVKVES